jgi:predicted AAA+ superfamily ATPase
MIEREKYHEVTELLDSFPAVAIIGPRQVGKTTLATRSPELGLPSIWTWNPSATASS